MLNLTCGSLFSGCGLGDLGIEWAGFEHRWFCEVDDYARQVLAKRWPGREIYGDIQEVDFSKVERVDLLTGGFPCQDISTAGKGAGINGTRSGLWKYFARAIDVLRPGFVLVENSPRLTGRGLSRVLGDLSEIGYDAEWRCLSAAALGAPHKRDRIWIVGYPGSVGRNQGGANHGKHDRTVPASDGQHAREMAYTTEQRLSNRRRFPMADTGKEKPESERQGCISKRTQVASNANSTRREEFNASTFAAGAGFDSGISPTEWGASWWAVEPGLGRVVDGCANRVDRCRGIGNGQVPHCTYYFARLIRQTAHQIGYVPVAESYAAKLEAV